MLNKKFFITCYILVMVLVGPVFINAQTIAIHPLKGEPYEVAVMYAEVLQNTLIATPDWSIFVIVEDDNWPGDVPPGGFSAILCPRPSITGGAPYALTGEVADDPEYYGSYRLRLYFWDMSTESLLAMDELTAPDKSTCEMIMPLLLDNLLPAARTAAVPVSAPPVVAAAPTPTPGPAPAPSAASFDPSRWRYIGPPNSGRRTTPVDNPEEWIYFGPDGPKWLNLGIRIGGGSSQWYYDFGAANTLGNDNVSEFWNANVALQASLNISRFFAIQTEANFSADIGNYSYFDGGSGLMEDRVFWDFALTIPLLFRFNLIGSHLRAGIFAGPHVYLSLASVDGEALGDLGIFEPDLPGFTFGLSIGWRLGPGNIFLDGRFEYDGLWYNQGRDPVFFRNSFKVNLGYEWTLINKR